MQPTPWDWPAPKRLWLERPGGRLAVLDFGGDGPGMLLLHGLMGRATTWAGTARRLAGAFHVVAIDQRGHGASDRFGSYSRDDYVEDAAAAVRELGLAPAVVVGHSMGGLNAWVVAARHPELVAGLVIEDMPSRTAGRGELDRFREGSRQWPVPFLTLADVRAYFGRDRACTGRPVRRSVRRGRPMGTGLSLPSRTCLRRSRTGTLGTTTRSWVPFDARPSSSTAH